MLSGSMLHRRTPQSAGLKKESQASARCKSAGLPDLDTHFEHAWGVLVNAVRAGAARKARGNLDARRGEKG